MKISAIIPSSLLEGDVAEYIKNLIKNNITDIIIADEGEDDASARRIKEACSLPGVMVIGKGRRAGRGKALKEAFGFLAENRPDSDGALCFMGNTLYPCRAAADCAEAFAASPEKIIFAGEKKDGGSVSFLEKAAASVSSFIYRFAIGIHLKNTKSGLCCIPAKYFSFFAKLPGKAKGYETRMLTGIMNEKLEYREIFVSPDNGETKRKKKISFKESFINYSIVLAYFVKFAISSVSSYLIDMGVYALLLFFLESRLSVGSQVLVCTVASRIISSIFNYVVNRKTVFKATDNFAGTTVRYYIIAVVKSAASYALIYLFADLLNITGFAQLIVKALVDIILFLFSFQIQKNWVFKHKNI